MRRAIVLYVCLGLSLVGCKRPGPSATPNVTSSAPTPPQTANALTKPGGPVASGPKESLPTCRFFEATEEAPGVEATHIVYVIDNSGAMLLEFDRVVEGLLDSVGCLQEEQEFQVYFYSKDTFHALLPGGLRPATDENKIEFARALRGIVSSGYGRSPIPALIPAFEALKVVPDKPGVRKVLFILSESDIDSGGCLYNRNEPEYEVRDWLRKNNADKAVHVYPIILGDQPAKETEADMKALAGENGGEYRFVKAQH